MSRYDSRVKATNNHEMYEKLFEKRDVKQILQYTTPILQYPNDETLDRVQTVDHVWSQGDRFWRLASKQYGDPSLWWVIAQFNKKPTEGHLAPGDTIKIPLDLGVILGVLK